MLIISQDIQEQIQAHGAASYPYEGCGLLLGRAENGRSWQLLPDRSGFEEEDIEVAK